MSYLQKRYHSENDYLLNDVSSYNVNRDRVGISMGHIDSFLNDILNNEKSIEEELLSREEELDAYRARLEQNKFINDFNNKLIEKLKKENLIETHKNDKIVAETIKKRGVKLGTKRGQYVTYKNIEKRLKSLPPPAMRDLEMIQTGDGIFDYVKNKFKKGVQNIKSLGKLLFMKYWKDLAIILFRLARNEDIKDDDLLFVNRMIENGLLNPANKNFKKLTSYFGEKLINKLKQLITIRNRSGTGVYPSKIRY